MITDLSGERWVWWPLQRDLHVDTAQPELVNLNWRCLGRSKGSGAALGFRALTCGTAWRLFHLCVAGGCHLDAGRRPDHPRRHDQLLLHRELALLCNTSSVSSPEVPMFLPAARVGWLHMYRSPVQVSWPPRTASDWLIGPAGRAAGGRAGGCY